MPYVQAGLWGIYLALVVVVGRLAVRDWKAARTSVDMKALVVTALTFAIGLAAIGTGLAYWPGLP
jgi:hypothetical protein